MPRHRGSLRASARRSLALALALAFSGLWLGCPSGPRKIGEQPSWRQSGPAQASDGPAAAPLGEPFVFAPPGPAAQAYNDPPIAPAPSSPLADAIVGTVAEMYTSAGATAPRPDGRLYAAAAELAAVVPEDGPLAYPLIEFALQRHGIVEPSPHLVMIWGPLDDPAPIVEQLRERLPAILATGTFARVGVGAASRPGGDGVAILALQDSHVETRPIPRGLPKGGIITVEGRTLGDYRQPAVWVTRDSGAVEEITSSPGTEFRARFSCEDRRGRQQVEITAVDASGSTVLANFPVWCNQAAPASITVHAPAGDSEPARTTAEAEARMLELVNRDRAAHGLGPLILAEDVSAVARAHSKEMRETGRVGHVSPITGSAADRVRAASIRTSMVLENIARAYGVAEAQTGLMNSPGHRANVLSTQATHIGIGIELGGEVAGRREMFVTQVFTRVPPPITLIEARQRLHAKIARRGGVSQEEPLSVLAQRYAEGLMDERPAAEMAGETAEKLDAFGARFRKVTTSVMAVADIESFDAKEAIADEDVTHYGLGVAQGEHEDLGEQTLFIVLLLAQAR